MHIAINTNSISVAKRGLVERINWIYDNKFDGVELSCSPDRQGTEGLWQWDRKFERSAVHALRNALCGFKSHTVHANFFGYYDETFCGLHPLCREIAIDDFVFAMDLAQEVRAGTVTIHSGWLCYGRSPEERRATLSDGLKRLDRLARSKSMMIGVENADYFMPLDRFKLLYELALDHVGITLDVGHAMFKNVGIPVAPSDVLGYEPYGSIGGFIREFRSKIVHVHVHDFRDGKDHLPIGKGEIDFRPIVAALKEAGYDGALCLELDPDRAGPQEIIESRDRLREFIAG